MKASMQLDYSAFQRSFAAIGIAGVAAILVGTVIATSLYQTTAAAGLVMALLVALISFAWAHRQARDDGFGLPSLVALYFTLAYSVGPVYLIIVGDADPRSAVTPDDLIPVLAVALTALVCLIVGFQLGRIGPVIRFRRSMTGGVPSAVAVRMSIVWLLGWGARVLQIQSLGYFHSLQAGGEVTSSETAWWIAAFSTLPLLVTALAGAFTYLRPADDSTSSMRRAFLILLLIEGIWVIPVGSRAAIVTLALVSLVIVYYGLSHLPTKRLALSIVLAVFVVFPFYLLYRGNGATYQSQPVEQLVAAAQQLVSGSPMDIAGVGLRATLSRFEDARTAAVAIRDRSNFTREPGETLSWIPSGFVPRFLLPSKADPGLFGNEFGRSFGLIGPTDYVTSIAFGQPVELLVNFGPLGLVAGMTILGAVYGLIDKLLMARRDRDPWMLAIYAVMGFTVVTSLGVIVANGLMGSMRMIVLYLLMMVFIAASAPGISAQARQTDQ